MQDEAGQQIQGKNGKGNFNLLEKEFLRNTALMPWEIGKWRVDGTLLARQKVRWYGVDRFLENHGGPEFADKIGKNRLDFGEAEDLYSVFVKVGDSLIWNGERWQVIEPGPESISKPLLIVKKIEDRVMGLELWDVEGKGKITLNIIRLPENFASAHLVNDFKFVGARTKTQVVFEINQERMIVRPHDWLLLTSEGWKNLKTAQEIDDYVNRKTIGPLFIFEDIIRKEDKSFLKGTVYNPSRSEAHEIEMAMLPVNLPNPNLPVPDKNVEENKNNN